MKVGNLRIPAALMMLASAAAFAVQPVDERWDINSNANISVENVAGVIEIRGWDRNEAQLTGELGDSVDKLDITANDTSLRISVVNRNQRNVDSTKLKLMIPEGANVDASAVSADIGVFSLDNERLTANSVSGDIDVDASSRRVSIESVSGDLEFRGETARIAAETVSGDMELTGIAGEIEATTVSGDMELKAGLVDSMKLETVSGDVIAVAEVSGNGKLSAESMSGDVTILLPASQAGTFRAQSFSGRIDTDFGAVERAPHGPGSHLKHIAGRGGAELRIESFSGNIKLKHD